MVVAVLPAWIKGGPRNAATPVASTRFPTVSWVLALLDPLLVVLARPAVADAAVKMTTLKAATVLRSRNFFTDPPFRSLPWS
jgi:hypothetical protein